MRCLTIKTMVRHVLSAKNNTKTKLFMVKTKSTCTRVKSTIVNRYKKCRFWFFQSLKRIANWKGTAPTEDTRTGQNGIDHIFHRLDKDKDMLVRRVDANHDLYPNCDTSIWVRNCTREIQTPILGATLGKYNIYMF